MSRTSLILAGGIATAAVALFLWRSGTREVAPPAERFNVLLITIDTLRADRVGRGLTPNIDAVASRGTSFNSVRATVPLTLPSHVSLMTGTIPPVHGVRENGVVFDRKRPTIARIFREAGYATAAFVGAYVLNRRFGLDDGFETYDDRVTRDPARMERLEAERSAADVVDATLTWLEPRTPSAERRPAEPRERRPPSAERRHFFIWVHLYDPHAPYTPPAEYLQKANGNAYDGEVAYADAQVGRLIAALDERGLRDSTVIAITGDHGEGLGEHGEQTHGMLAYDSTLLVPLVLAAPGSPRAPGSPCHWELAPAVLRLSGLGDRVPQGMASGLSAECSAYGETIYPRRAGWHALTTLADNRWKLIASSEGELYDLQNDPRELTNVAADHPGIVQAMSATVTKLKGTGQQGTQVAPEAAERLRALGYVAGSSAITRDDSKAPNPARAIVAWSEFERALGILQSGNAASAAAPLKALAEEHPESPVFQSTYAQALRESGNARAALAVYKTAVARWSNDANLFHDLAVAAREAGDVQEAIRAERAALALQGTNPMALNGLGLAQADAGQLNEAATSFEQAAAADPGNASYWTNLGNARRELGQADAADRAYRRALGTDADYPDALNGLGVMLVQSKRAAEAVPHFERALARDPTLHEARLNLGIAYQESGQRERAIATYRDVLSRAPASAKRERDAAADLLRQLTSR